MDAIISERIGYIVRKKCSVGSTSLILQVVLSFTEISCLMSTVVASIVKCKDYPNSHLTQFENIFSGFLFPCQDENEILIA